MFFNVKAKILELLLNDKDIQKAIVDLVSQNSQEKKIFARYTKIKNQAAAQEEEETAPAIFDANCEEQRAAIYVVDKLSVLTVFPHFQRTFVDEEDKLRTLNQFCADFGHVALLWDELESRCKRQGTPLSDEDLNVLTVCVHQHNKHQSKENQIKLNHVQKGQKYDYEIHKQAFSSQGNRIKYCVIPGLICANGKTVKKTVVCTEK